MNYTRKSFSVASPGTQTYRDNWDATFSAKPAQRGCDPANKHSRCENAAAGLHTCPYRAEINDDILTLCRCCEECEAECSDDI